MWELLVAVAIASGLWLSCTQAQKSEAEGARGGRRTTSDGAGTTASAGAEPAGKCPKTGIRESLLCTDCFRTWRRLLKSSSMCISISISISTSTSIYIYLSTSIYLHLSIYIYLSTSIYLHLSIYIYLSILSILSNRSILSILSI